MKYYSLNIMKKGITLFHFKLRLYVAKCARFKITFTYLSKFLRWSLMIFISKSFLTIVFIFIVFFHNVSAAVSSGLPRVSSVYLGIEMIQPKKSFLKSNKAFKNYEDLS